MKNAARNGRAASNEPDFISGLSTEKHLAERRVLASFHVHQSADRTLLSLTDRNLADSSCVRLGFQSGQSHRCNRCQKQDFPHRFPSRKRTRSLRTRENMKRILLAAINEPIDQSGRSPGAPGCISIPVVPNEAHVRSNDSFQAVRSKGGVTRLHCCNPACSFFSSTLTSAFQNRGVLWNWRLSAIVAEVRRAETCRFDLEDCYDQRRIGDDADKGR